MTLYLSRLPNDILWTIMNNKSYPEVMHICDVDPELDNRICRNNAFWLRRLTEDYPNITEYERSLLAGSINPSEDYLLLKYSRWIEIYQPQHLPSALIVRIYRTEDSKEKEDLIALLEYYITMVSPTSIDTMLAIAYDVAHDIYADDNESIIRELSYLLDYFLTDPRQLQRVLRLAGDWANNDFRDYIYGEMVTFPGENALSNEEIVDLLILALETYRDEDAEVAEQWATDKLQDYNLTPKQTRRLELGKLLHRMHVEPMRIGGIRQYMDYEN